MKIKLEKGWVKLKSKFGDIERHETNGITIIELPDKNREGKPFEWQIIEKEGKIKELK